MHNTKDTATQFVNLALKHTQWNEIKSLPEDEMKILFDTVSAAGFSPKQIVPGRLIRYYQDEKGDFTNETYPINGFCQFKVVDQKNSDNYFATGWLDCALRRVVLGIKRKKEVREDFIEVMIGAIEQSVPLKPIQLTREGDFLSEYPPRKSVYALRYFIDHTRDKNNLNSCIGVHQSCDGPLNRISATKTQDAIKCLKCSLHILIPKDIRTYSDLRRHFSFRQI